MKHFVLCLLMLAGGFFLQACEKAKESSPAPAPSSSSSTPSGPLKIAVIPKGTTHVYWKSVQAGAYQAGKDLGADIIWKGPLEENDRAQQISIVEQFVSDGVNGIVLAPLDDNALVRPVKEAQSAKIPVIIIDSALKGQAGKDFTSYVSTDNRRGGELAGEQLVKLLDGKGKVALLRDETGSASTEEREAGFLEVMHKTPGITVIVDNRYGGSTASKAQSAAMEMIDQINEADGLFCPNESTTAGMLQALRNARSDKARKFVGFDATPQLVDALKDGKVDALVAQNPYKMGYEGVKVAVLTARGESLPTRIDTGVRVITKADLGNADTKAFLSR